MHPNEPKAVPFKFELSNHFIEDLKKLSNAYQRLSKGRKLPDNHIKAPKEPNIP